MADFQLVSNELLDLNKDCNKVVIALTDIHHKWTQLAVYLNIPNGTIESIADRHNNSHFKQTAELISTWIRRPTREHHPSWRVLCQALAAMGEIGVADKIAAGNKREINQSSASERSSNPPQYADLLDILSSIPVTTQLPTFCINLGLPSARCSEIFDDPTIRGDFPAQRHRMLRLWGEVKERTWEDFVKALYTTGCHQKAKELAERYKIQLIIK